MDKKLLVMAAGLVLGSNITWYILWKRERALIRFTLHEYARLRVHDISLMEFVKEYAPDLWENEDWQSVHTQYKFDTIVMGVDIGETLNDS